MKNQSLQIIKVGGIEFTVLFKGLIPGISEEEYERLKEDIAVHGVLVPVVCDEKRGIIDGVCRLKAASELNHKTVPFNIHYGLSSQEKKELAIRLNCHRRHLTKDERLALAIALRKEGYSYRRIGEVLNLGHESVRRNLLALGDTEEFPKTVIGKDGVKRPAKRKRKACVVLKDLREAKKAFDELAGAKGLKPWNNIIDRKTLSKKIKHHKSTGSGGGECDDVELGRAKLTCGDFREKGSQIASESVDLVFTDPPYKEDALPLWEALGQFAQRVLRPGGILLSYSGNMYLPKIHEMLGRHLQYFWTFAVRHTGGNTLVRNVNVQQTYKPVLGYFKPPFNKFWHPFLDMVSGGRSKEHHEWEQPVEEAQHFIKNLCPKGGIVVDPMMGPGSFILAGLSLGLDCTGIEIDTTPFATAKERVESFHKSVGKKAA